MLKEHKPKFGFLDFEKADALMAAAAEIEPEWLAFVIITARTFLRVGELVALRWREDVELGRRVTDFQSTNTIRPTSFC